MPGTRHCSKNYWGPNQFPLTNPCPNSPAAVSIGIVNPLIFLSPMTTCYFGSTVAVKIGFGTQQSPTSEWDGGIICSLAFLFTTLLQPKVSKLCSRLFLKTLEDHRHLNPCLGLCFQGSNKGSYMPGVVISISDNSVTCNVHECTLSLNAHFTDTLSLKSSNISEELHCFCRGNVLSYKKQGRSAETSPL